MLPPVLCDIILQVLASSIRQENKIKNIYIGNQTKAVIIYRQRACPGMNYDEINKKMLEISTGKVKIFTDNMIIYRENCKESTEKNYRTNK